MALAIFYGCSHSGGSFFVDQLTNKNITSKEAVIDGQGRLSTISFSSGAKIEALEENTLTPGIVVPVVEQKMNVQNTAFFKNSSNSEVYFYKITAFFNPTNTVKAKTYVTTTEKPFKIKVPKPKNSRGVAFVGIKESDSDPWRYFSLSDTQEILANMAGVRFAGKNTGEYSFDIFRLGTQFSLVTYGDDERSKLPDTFVSSLIASSTASISVKNGKYLDDLRIKGILKGKKLDSIKPTDFRARITYRNNLADEAPLRVNNTNVIQQNKADRTVPGNTYVHSFDVDSISGYNLNDSDGEFSFTLNLSGVDVQRFPTGFLIEFYNKVDSEKILPYIYSEFYTFETREKQNEPEPQPQIAEEFSITYNLDGGTIVSTNPMGYNTASETFTLKEPTKEGYRFIGWTGSNGDTPQKDLSVVQGSKSNMSFNANYELITYNITYELDGGQTSKGNPTSYDVTSATIILNNPTKEGCRFVGWTGSNGDTPQTTLVIEKGSIGNRTYSANYTTANYVLTYNLDGGIVTPVNPTGYNSASETFTLNEPTKEGYTFIGWTGSNGDIPQKDLTIIQGSKSDRTYTANYTLIVYSIAYELNGGVLGTSNPISYDVTSSTIVLNNPTREGYTFTGWSGSNGNTPQTTLILEKGSTGSKSFTANWSKNSYNVTLAKGTGIADVTGDGMHEYGSTVTASCTMVDGYEFDFWAGNNTESTFIMPANDIVMQANAKLKTYSITYNLYDGDVAAPNRTSYNLNSEDITLVNPAKTGFTFDGWTGSNGDTPQTEVTISTGSTGDRTYSANYSVINYTIDYYLNGGSVAEENPENYNVTTADIVLVNPTKDEFRFVGWTGSNGDEPQPTVTIEQGSIGNKVFSANYVQATNIITYNLNGGTNHPDNPHGFNPASSTFTLYPASKFGHIFVGWTGSNGDIPQMVVTIESGSIGDRTYIAHFEEVPYAISYLLNGGTNNPLNQAGYAAYMPTFTLYEPTRDGFAFVGWTEGMATFPMIITKIPSGSTGDKVFTAHWIECLKFNLPGNVPLVMHKCSAGTFTMGSPDGEVGRDYDENDLRESPQHQVTLTKDFYIGKFEITQEQYQAVMGTNPSNFAAYADSASRPVEFVTWDDSVAFCASLTTYLSASIPTGYQFNLPTEAQWEYACRAGTTSSLNNGTDITSATGIDENLGVVAWYDSISTSQTHVVGQKQPNAWGLYDMHGNVWEWCLDRYKQTYYADCLDCSDPTGPSTGSRRVPRGGGWGSDPKNCRSASRSNSNPSTLNYSFGFRVVLTSNLP